MGLQGLGLAHEPEDEDAAGSGCDWRHDVSHLLTVLVEGWPDLLWKPSKCCHSLHGFLPHDSRGLVKLFATDSEVSLSVALLAALHLAKIVAMAY